MKVNKSFVFLLQGYALFYESMLPSVLHIRDHWMKKVRIKDRKKFDKHHFTNCNDLHNLYAFIYLFIKFRI